MKGSQEDKNDTMEETHRMKISDLREALSKLNLPTEGTRSTLIARLRETLDSQDEEDNEKEDSSSDDEISITDLRRETTRGATPKFTFKDVEDSLMHFSGDDDLAVERWVREFEETSMMLEWNEMQQLVYAKRLLKGSARRYITFEKGVISWEVLKSRLFQEFRKEINSATLHNKLFKRHKQPTETYRQYIYAMQEIASYGQVEEEALIQYIIDGIQDEESNKAVLYSSATLKELKKNFEIYERMRERGATKKMPALKKDSVREIQKDGKAKAKKMHCFNCGSTEHDVKNCSHKEKGPKCFRCNNFGHTAPNCTKTAASKEPTVVSCTSSNGSSVVQVVIGNTTCQALIDTGSEVNLLRSDIYQKLGSPELQPSARTFRGLGSDITKPFGRFYMDVMVNGELYHTEVFVVSADVLSHELIIGHELLRNAEVVIREGQVTIKRVSATKEQSKQASEIKTDPKEHGGLRSVQKQEEQCNMWEASGLGMVAVVDDELQNQLQVPAEYRDRVLKMIQGYTPCKDVHTDVRTKIVLSDPQPITSQPRRLAYKEKQIVEDQIEEWLRDGIIKPSSSPYSSPVVVVPKKDGRYRVCIDYRRINKHVSRDSDPMPLIEDKLDSLTGATVFSVLDLKNGFFHVPVEPESQKYTAFVVHSGQYEFLKTPFGLSVSPMSFLRFVDEVFRDLVKEGIVTVYMDDIIIPGRNEEEAFERLKKVLEVAAKSGLNLNWKKCQLLQKKVEFLGYVIQDSGISPSPSKIKAVKDFPEPKTLKQVRAFLGLTGYFRKFVPGYAKIARPLYDIKNEGIVNFNEEQRLSFEQLKAALTEAPVLRLFNPSAATEVHTDASKLGYGAVLLQKMEGEKHPRVVQYLSAKTTEAESKWSAYELEVYAVVKALQKFRVYLLGRRFKVVTDCKAIQGTLHKKVIPPKIARWILALDEFDFELEHRSGDRIHPVFLVEDVLVALIGRKQEDDKHLKAVKKLVEAGSYEDYSLKNNLLMKQVGDRDLVVVPESMEMDIIRMVHEHGHFSTRKMRTMAKQEILKLQAENCKAYNKKCKEAPKYEVGGLVFIQRTQGGPGLKIKPKFLGPYEVTKIGRGNRYHVAKVGTGEGPKITTTVVDYMKPYAVGTPEDRSGGQNSRV